MKYKPFWTEFEVQSLAYGILRKHLYPEYLVRGEYKFDKCRTDIAIFKANKNGEEPTLKVIVEVKKNPAGTTTSQAQRYEALLEVPCIYVRGTDDAYNILNLVSPLL